MPSLQQTLEQERAAAAWEDVDKAPDRATKILQETIAEARRKNEAARVRELEPVLKRLGMPEGADNFRKAYGSLARKTPALIMSAGLGPTLAFLRAKGKDKGWDEHNVLYRHLSGWVVKRLPGNPGDLLDVVRQNSSDVYRLATVEALAFLTWLKRFAEAVLPEAEGSEG